MAEHGNLNDALSQLMLVLGGRQPAQAPQGQSDAHLRGLFGPPAPAPVDQEAAFRALQAGGNNTSPPVDPNAIQRALGSLFGTR